METYTILITFSEKDALKADAVWKYNLKYLPNNASFCIVCENNKTLKLIQHFFNAHFVNISYLTDAAILNKKQLEWCGWSRQQMIKLLSFNFIENPYIICVGSDVLLLKPFEDIAHILLYKYNHAIIPYRNKHVSSNQIAYEIKRNQQVAEILHLEVEAFQKEIKKDYIFDIFPFDRSILSELFDFIHATYGGLENIFPFEVTSIHDKGSVGEWSLYALFYQWFKSNECTVIPIPELVYQIHSCSYLENIPKKALALHIVDKQFEATLKILQHGNLDNK